MQYTSPTPFFNRTAVKWIAVGLALGVGSGGLALASVMLNPLIVIAALVGLGVGAYVLLDLMAGLYLTVAVVALLPFATLPARIAVTPTLIDLTLGGFLFVYLMLWMKRRRPSFRAIPATGVILLFVLFVGFSFINGLANAAPTTSVSRKFIELCLSILLPIAVIDVIRDAKMLRRLTLIVVLAGSAQAAIGGVLYRLNDPTAERLLTSLARIGYPGGGRVLRYIEDNPGLGERAIGTWVDPNAYGGFLMMIAAVIGVQILARKPVLPRWILIGLFGLTAVVMVITQSRGALLALGGAILFVALVRHRWLLIVMAIAGLLAFPLPFTQRYLARLIEGFNGQDLSTQMRLGEYKDAFILIGRYPLIGVGFTGAPDRDIYLGVSSMYLKIAGGTGFIGLSLFALVMIETFRYGFRRWSRLRANADLFDVWLGFTAGIIGVLISGVVDHFYFNIEFHASVTIFWLYVGLSLATARVATDHMEVTWSEQQIRG